MLPLLLARQTGDLGWGSRVVFVDETEAASDPWSSRPP